MLTNKEIVNKLRVAIKNSSKPAKKIAELAGISEVTLYRILNGQRNLNNLDTLQKLAKALNLPLGYFFGEADMQNKALNDFDNIPDIRILYGDLESLKELDLSGYLKIPLMRSKAAATPYVIEISNDDIDGWVCISTDKIPKNISEKCFAFRVKGDSMEPMLQENDLVAILPYSSQPDLFSLKYSNVYLVRMPDGNGEYGLTLKHIKVIDRNTVVLVSDNKNYEPVTINLRETPGFKVVGRVVWMWREF
ncbi:LexA family transcriptional regulator [Deferribacter autotrophicus]|uniref:LexA family transcriptional regulator n=1 Tax=Deferribacter autotrophicus TaxID=500465 RepID=A0A5A8F6Q4_9BACT|nr:LexA family transcriptional regulator [Deferribacter autotrophicus]KAA0259520.1 LexA family transcriptional regulator [Deferribacter autotrophicus]